MTHKEILEMDADEFYNWMSYDMLKDEKFNKRIQLLRSQQMDDEARSQAIKAMFHSIGGS